MKLFDYKFLILLGLTLVVYFMFREILDLKKKIETIETNVDNVDKKVNSIEYNDKVNNKKVNKVSATQPKQLKQTNELENKPIFQIPLPPKPTEKKFDFQPQIDVNEVNKLSTINESTNVTKTETDNVEESINEEENVEDVQEIEHLAIYSNDNDDTNENYSLDDTSELITDDIILSNNSSEEQICNNDDEKKKNLLVESEGDNDLNTPIDILDDKNSLEEKTDDSGGSDYTISNLMKHKLSELQCIAEGINISINNEERGKKKTKSELSNDILKYYDNNLKTNNNLKI